MGHPLEILLEDLLTEQVFFHLTLLNLPHLVRLQEAVHPLIPLLMLHVHQIHQRLVLISDGLIVRGQVDGFKEALFGRLKLTVGFLGYTQSIECFGIILFYLDGFLTAFDSLAGVIALKMAQRNVQ